MTPTSLRAALASLAGSLLHIYGGAAGFERVECHEVAATPAGVVLGGCEIVARNVRSVAWSPGAVTLYGDAGDVTVIMIAGRLQW